MRPEVKNSAWTAALCVLAILLLASWLTTRSTLWDRDEPRFAQAAVEMVRSGNLLFPTFNGELRCEKPILIYWLMALPVRCFGVSEWAVRAFAPIALALSAWLTWGIARRFVSQSAALFAALILASSPLALGEGTVATTDAVLLACITAAMALFAIMLADGWRGRNFLALTLALGAAQLVKGPVGLGVPMLSILAVTWILRGKEIFARGFMPRVWIAALASIAVFCAWAIPANIATGGEFARRGLGHQVGDRMVQPMEGHGGNYLLGLFFYVPVLVLGIGPWIMQLPAALIALWSGRLGHPRLRALLLAWIVVPFCLMSLVATKLPHYILPIFPALAIAVASVIDAAEHGALAARDVRWLARGAWWYAGLLALEFGALTFAALGQDEANLRLPLFVVGLTLVVPGALAIALHARRRWRMAAIASLLGTVAMCLALGWVALPRLEEIKLAPRLAKSIQASTPESTSIATYAFDEPSLNFYCGRSPIERLATETAVDTWAKDAGDGVLVIPRAKLVDLAQRTAAGKLRELSSVNGFNYSKGKPMELVALRRGQTEH